MSKGQSSWAEHLSAVRPCPCTVTKLPQSKAEPVLPMASNSGQNQRLPSYSGNQEKKRLFQLDSPFYKYLFYFLGQRCIEFFQQWLGWIPRWNLCKGCSGPQALVVSPTLHRLPWVGRSAWAVPFLAPRSTTTRKVQGLCNAPPPDQPPPTDQNRVLKGGTKQPLVKRKNFFHSCFVFVPCSVPKSWV